MARNIMSKFLLAAAVLSSANAYFLFGMKNVITTERIDPIVNPGKVSGHVHTIVGGSNFRVNTTTAFLRQSECTSSPIKEDKSNYWAPTLYFQWSNGSFTSVNGSPVIYYLFSDTAGVTTPFPDDFRMLSGTPTLRSYNASSYAQQAVTFLCLDFSGTSTKHNELPTGSCPSGIRAQINFPSCWDGVNSDSADHKSHVAYLSGGPDSGTCADKNYPKTLPRIFMEMYLDTASFDSVRSQAKNPSQPFVYSMGDPTGYGYHADFIFGWDKGVLDNVVNKCQCTSAAFGDPTCCSNSGVYTLDHDGTCRITKGVDEITTGTLPALPGNNPVVPLNGQAVNLAAPVIPALISPVYAYTGDSPTQTGKPVGPPSTVTGGGAAGQTTAVGATTTAVGATTTAKGATTTANGAPTDKGATTAKQATSAPASSPTSGSGTGSGSPGQGSGSGTSSGTGSSSGSGNGSNSGSGNGSSSGSGNGSSSGSGNGSSSGSGNGSNSGPGSGSGAPAKGSGSGSPSNGNSGSGSGSGSAPPSTGSSGNHTCHKKKRANVRRARAFHESSRRRFATPEQRFVEHDI